MLLIAIRPSDGDVKPGDLLGTFREEQAMSQHRVAPFPFLSSTLSSSSSHSPQHNYTTHTVTLTSTSYSTLYRYSSQSAPVVHDLKIDHT